MHGYKIVNQNHIHFITPTIVGWLDVFTRKKYKDIVVDSLNFCIENKGLSVHAYVIMSNHLHLVVSAKEGYELSDILRDFKSHTARHIIKDLVKNSSESRRGWMLRLLKYYAKYNSNNSKYQLWKRDNHPVELVSNLWIGRRINYTHQNPVKAGIVKNAEDYIYSSALDYLENDAVGLVKVECLQTHL